MLVLGYARLRGKSASCARQSMLVLGCMAVRGWSASCAQQRMRKSEVRCESGAGAPHTHSRECVTYAMQDDQQWSVCQ
eukprot:scaffold26804_cov17-Tisochrysis_lutea.AAC.1